MLSSDFSSFDSRVMLEYEEFLNIYDRFKDVNFAIAYKLIERNILDNATRESIISLGESGDLEGCALLEELESKDLDLEIQKWIRV